MQFKIVLSNRPRWLAAIQILLLLLVAPLVASATGFSVDLQGQSRNDTNWVSGGLMGWRELDYIPVRVFLTGGPAANQAIRVDFEHMNGSKPGIQNLMGFFASTNVIITSGPTLSAPVNSGTWSYSFTVSLTNNTPGFVEFRARLLAGAHVNTGSGLSMGGSPSLGQLQIFKPAAGAGSPDLALQKTGPTNAAPGDIITYNLSYTNRAISTNTAIGVQVSDILPTAVTYVGGSNTNGAVVGNTVFWDIGNLPVGAQGVVSYQVQVNADVAYSQVFSNFAQILSSEDDANYADNGSGLSTKVLFNRPPVASNDTYSVAEFQTLVVAARGVLTNDTDIDGDTLTVGSPRPLSGPSHGSLTLNADGSFSYTPTGNYTGTDSFTYMANDGSTNSSPATVTITVLQVNTPPSITCPGALAVSCGSGVPAPDISTVTASDHCGGGSVTVTFVSDTMSASNCFNQFVITRTYRATDLCGNHADCTQTITVHDVTPPSITCPPPVTVSCASSVPAPDISGVIASDGCGGLATVAFVSDAMSASNCANHFVITRTYRATDACGNHADCSQTITVQDSTPPSVTCPAAVTVDCASTVPAPNISGVTATDGCAGGAITLTFVSDTMSASNCANQFVITRTYRATDVCGNHADCTQTITVNDTTPPTITCPAPVAVSCASAVPVPDTALVTTSDGCAGGAVTLVFVGDAMSGSNCFNQFVITRTYRATDACGNYANCSQTITVNDTTPPAITCPAAITVNCASDLPAPDASLVTATDGCGGGVPTVTFVNDTMSTSNCVDQFVITRTYRATDTCGNKAECSQTITVRDLTPPSITCPAALTVSCASDLPAPDTSLVLSGDGCGGGATVTFLGDTMSASNCFNQFTITRSYRATDACGNYADCSQTITVNDTTAPVITCPAAVTVNCASDLPAPDASLVTATDGCGGGVPTVTFVNDTMSASNCFNQFTITRTYRATDACGNHADCAQTLTVNDVTPPSITCPGLLSVNCASEIPVPDVSLVTAADGCAGGLPIVTFVGDAMSVSNCFNQFVITRTYRATDACGNYADCGQTITVNDINPPTITCPAPITVSCASAVPAPDISLVSASDGCGGGLATVTFIRDTLTASNCPNQFIILRTYRATDACGNPADCAQTITVNDVIPPTITCPAPVTVDCASAVPVPDISLVTASDGCGGGFVTVSFINDVMSASNCPNQFVMARTYRATDPCANHAECVQTITVHDTTPPSITCPAAQTVNCASDLPVPDVSLVIATDGCGGGAPTVTFVNDTISASNCFNQFTITRTYRATDACGNYADCAQTITVNDVTPPSITCPGPLSVNCASEIPAPDLSLVTATDGCGGGLPIVTFVGDAMIASNCFNQFVIMRTYRATDACGNYADCGQTITVNDINPPTITCPAPVTVSCATAVPAPDISLVSVSDGCGGGLPTVTFIGDAMSASNCVKQFVIARTYRATDACGNQADCTQTITVQDIIAPTITCPAPVTVDCASAVPAPDISLVTASDGCGGSLVAVSFINDVMSASNCVNQFVIARTYRATDPCGNHADCVQTITVHDVTPPSITCPAAQTVNCVSEVPAPDTSLVSAGDGCGETPTVAFLSDTMSASNCPNRFTITRTYRATDACGNYADCSQTITVNDVTAPSMTCPTPLSVNCASAVPLPDPSLITASDGCGGPVTVTYVGDVMSASNCVNQFVITRTYRATDTCGNQAECMQSIIVNETTPPSITCPALVTVSCASGVPAPDVSLVTAGDGYGGGLATVTFIGDTMTASNCANQFVILRTYRATDACGNQADCGQTITINDVTPPTLTCPAPVTVDCASAVPAPDISIVTASDGCSGGLVTVSFVSDTMSASNCVNRFVVNRLYRTTDGCGNQAECTQTITVQDLTAPSITCPAAISVGCAASVPAPDTSLATTSDGCSGGTVTVTFASDTMSASNCPNQFSITRTYRATDACGNHAECSQTITVNDVTSPSITCPGPLTVVCTSPVPAPNTSLVTVTDGCGGGTPTVTFVSDVLSAPIDCFSQTVITRTYRATDACGNQADCTQLITVLPVNHAPVAANDAYSVNEDTVLSIVAPGVLGNDTDSDGNGLTPSVLSLPAHGSLTFSNNGSFVYTPAPNYNGSDAFTYQVSDGQDQSGVATVNLTITPVNDPPAFTKGANQFVQIDAGAQTVPSWATAINAGPADEAGQTLTFIVTSDGSALFSVQPAVSASGTLTYTPAPHLSGTAHVTVTLKDSGGTANGGADTSAAQIFTITVNSPPTVSVVSPTNGTAFMAPATIPVIAEASDVDGSVSKVEVYRGTNMLAQANAGSCSTAVTNLGAGTYTFGAKATDDRGASATATPVTVTVLDHPPVTIVQAAAFNPQTGLFQERVRVSNPTVSTLASVRVLVTNLRTNVIVFNASGSTNGVPYVQSNLPLPPGGSIDFTIEYSVPDFQTPNPTMTAAVAQPAAPAAPQGGTVVPITRQLRMADGEFLLEFTSLSNRTYYVQYCSDMRAWKTAWPGVKNSAGRIQWLDNGAPRTECWPTNEACRFYRVLMAP